MTVYDPAQFGGGTLSCDAINCVFNTSQCVSFVLTGNVKAALTGNNISGVSVSIQDQAGIEFGSDTTDSNGNFTVGNLGSNSDYKIVIIAAEYKEGGKSHYSLSGDQSIQLYMLPYGWTGAAAIILRWGATPKDLDSHLVFGGTEIWYNNGNIDKEQDPVNGAQLDLDDTNKDGPETITIMVPVVGINYQYYVQDYTHCDDGTSGSGATTAGASVQVWNQNAELVGDEYTSPGAGCRWEVFNMTIDVDKNITIL